MRTGTTVIRDAGAAIVMALFVLSAAVMPLAAHGQTPQPDFNLGIAFTLTDGVSPATGFLVRGGLPTCGANCVGSFEPRYDTTTGFPATRVWSSTSIQVNAINGFQGTVTLELLGLPGGVASNTAGAVTLSSTTLLCDSFGCWVGATTPLSLAADASAALSGSTVTLRATSGTIVHTVQLPIAVVDQLPPATLFGFSLLTPMIAGGNTVESVVTLTQPAPPGGILVALSASNVLVASPPTTIFIPEGSNGAVFLIPTSPVPTITMATLAAAFDGQTLNAQLKVVPPGGPDSLSNGKAEYVTSKQQLGVQVTSTSSKATVELWTTTGTRIGTLANAGGGTYKGQFIWPTYQDVVFRSSLGGTLLMTPTKK